MGWLDGILRRGRILRLRDFGSELPDNPTLDDFKKEAFRIGQLAKEVQNSKPGGFWPESHWRKISKAIDKLTPNQS